MLRLEEETKPEINAAIDPDSNSGAMAATQKIIARHFPTTVLEAIKNSPEPRLTRHELNVLFACIEQDWSSQTLSYSKSEDIQLAAEAVALGGVMFYGFGNFCAVAAHPHLEAVKYVNRIKGRPEGKVGSLTTTLDHVEELFDWNQLPTGLAKARVLDMVDYFYNTFGPFGFRGAARAGIPDHLTSVQGDIKTTQLIAPGARCLSTSVVEQAIKLIDKNYLFITSANRSHHLTGVEEAAHYRLSGIQADFGTEKGVIMIGHDDEEAVRATYPAELEPTSTSIISFVRLEVDEHGKPALVLERDGSLDKEVIRKSLRDVFDLGLVIGEGAKVRLPKKEYPK